MIDISNFTRVMHRDYDYEFRSTDMFYGAFSHHCSGELGTSIMYVT